MSGCSEADHSPRLLFGESSNSLPPRPLAPIRLHFASPRLPTFSSRRASFLLRRPNPAPGPLHGGPTTLVSNSAAILDPEPEGLGPGDLGPATWALPASLPHGSWDCLLILKWFLAQMRAPQGQNRGLWVPRMVSGVQKGGRREGSHSPGGHPHTAQLRCPPSGSSCPPT